MRVGGGVNDDDDDAFFRSFVYTSVRGREVALRRRWVLFINLLERSPPERNGKRPEYFENVRKPIRQYIRALTYYYALRSALYEYYVLLPTRINIGNTRKRNYIRTVCVTVGERPVSGYGRLRDYKSPHDHGAGGVI